jgi:hypothetical protein
MYYINLGDVSSESEDEERQINKYKSLVQSIKDSEEKKKKRDIEMEITWEPGKHINFHLMNTLIKLVPIGPVVSEEKIKMYMLTDDQAAAN